MVTTMGKVYVLTIFLALSALTKAELQPGLRLAIKDSALKSFLDYFVPKILKNFTTVPLNDTEISTNLDYVGDIKISFTNLRLEISAIKPEQINVLFHDNNTLSVFVNEMGSSIEFEYAFESKYYNSKGHGNAGFSNLSFILQNNLFALENQYSKTAYNHTALGPGTNIKKFVLTSLNVDVKFDNDLPLERFIVFLVDNINQIFKKQLKGNIKN